MKNKNTYHFLKKFAVAGLALAIVLTGMLPGVSAPARAIDDPEITTAAAYLWDIDAKQVLYSKNAQERRAPASLTKIMTILLAVEAYENGEVSLNDTVTVGDDPYFDITPDGSSIGLKPGEELTFEQLLYSPPPTRAAMSLPSSSPGTYPPSSRE